MYATCRDSVLSLCVHEFFLCVFFLIKVNKHTFMRRNSVILNFFLPSASGGYVYFLPRTQAPRL